MIVVPGLEEGFKGVFGAGSVTTVQAPGRVNLIGEHTDYNEGYVLPMAIDRGVTIAGRKRTDNKVVLHSIDYRQKCEFDLGSIHSDLSARWADYFKGVAFLLKKNGLPLGGCEAVLQGDLPQGAGLSSSAALEVASATFLQKLFRFDLGDLDLIRLCQQAENEFVGVKCGIMDQFASYMGKEGHALFLDCRSLEYRWAVLPKGLAVVVCDTGVERTLAGSAYNERRAQCEAAVGILAGKLPGIKALRDVSLCDFEKHQGLLDPVVLKRCRHILTENQRVLDMVEALGTGRLERVKVLMEESHVSLRDDYEVSCRELDVLAELGASTPGVFGSRMTGAGFGGCTVHLVRTEAVEGFQQKVGPAYEERTGRKATIHVFNASDGAKFLNGMDR